MWSVGDVEKEYLYDRRLYRDLMDEYWSQNINIDTINDELVEKYVFSDIKFSKYNRIIKIDNKIYFIERLKMWKN